MRDGQKPHTLFITCSDSRIDPNMITGTLPGELFNIRNIANIIPPYGDSWAHVDTISAIEYAVIILGVEKIIICGHSNCGGCAISLNPSEQIDRLVYTRKWLELMNPVKELIYRKAPYCELDVQERMMEQVNVVEQLKNLMTYPYIRQKVTEGHLRLSGWHYAIETGEIFIFDEETEEFRLKN